MDTFKPWRLEALRLESLENQLCLWPCGNKKHPLVKGYSGNPKGFSVYECLNYYDYFGEDRSKRLCTSIGTTCGVNAGNLLVHDFDGKSALKRGENLGLSPYNYTTWQVWRSSNSERIKILFKLKDEQVKQLPTRDFIGRIITNGLEKEAYEVFFSGGRNIQLIGAHPSDDQYYWPSDLGPEALTYPSAQFWQQTLDIAWSKWKPKEKQAINSSSYSKSDWERLPNCPICGRAKRQFCSKHIDGRTIFCYRGTTYSPPLNLSKGDLVADCWIFIRIHQGIHGEFSVFVKDDQQAKMHRMASYV